MVQVWEIQLFKRQSILLIIIVQMRDKKYVIACYFIQPSSSKRGSRNLNNSTDSLFLKQLV